MDMNYHFWLQKLLWCTLLTLFTSDPTNLTIYTNATITTAAAAINDTNTIPIITVAASTTTTTSTASIAISAATTITDIAWVNVAITPFVMNEHGYT